MSGYTLLRQQMVKEQLQSRGIKNKKVVDAFLSVPREYFVPDILMPDAYTDRPLSIGYDQTISQPYIVALMTELLDLGSSDKVLEIGTGSGYQTAILAAIGCSVYSVERIPELAEKAEKILKTLKLNVSLKVDDGTEGWPEHSPYDKIIVTAAATVIPQPLIEQLSSPGTLIMPVGESFQQTLTILKKTPTGKSERTSAGGCIFVPLIGKYAPGN
ncbi:MAG: protein-L-isoaspartate(D-aspartate) O-methyltransferase [Candidatus Omnitrophica bacterium]|nr:protein-L-isoaspartate(D-aspartate) O-methyltransferase [Candidatus Omnitrophota bacterium]